MHCFLSYPLCFFCISWDVFWVSWSSFGRLLLLKIVINSGFFSCFEDYAYCLIYVSDDGFSSNPSPSFCRCVTKMLSKIAIKSGPNFNESGGKKWIKKWSNQARKVWSKKRIKIKNIALTATFSHWPGLLKSLTWRCFQESLKMS